MIVVHIVAHRSGTPHAEISMDSLALAALAASVRPGYAGSARTPPAVVYRKFAWGGGGL